MIVGSIQQVKEQLITDNTNIACQYAENLQMEIQFDGTYNNYSWLFFCGYSYEQPKAIPIEYNPTNKLITLPAEAFIKSGVLYIQAVAIKGDVKFPLNPVSFALNQSLSQNFISTAPTELEILKDLIEQVVANEYDPILQELIDIAKQEQEKVNNKVKELDEALSSEEELQRTANEVRIIRDDVQKNSDVAVRAADELQRTANEVRIIRDDVQKNSDVAVRAADEAKESEQSISDMIGQAIVGVTKEMIDEVKRYYEMASQLNNSITINVDCGNPFAVDHLDCDGGTPFTKESIVIDCGTPFTY